MEATSKPPPAGWLPALGLSLCLLFLSSPGLAEHERTPCGERDSILSQLEQSVSELIVHRAILSNGNPVEVLTSPNGETWTLLVTLPNGMVCLAATGENWKSIERMVRGRRT